MLSCADIIYYNGGEPSQSGQGLHGFIKTTQSDQNMLHFGYINESEIDYAIEPKPRLLELNFDD